MSISNYGRLSTHEQSLLVHLVHYAAYHWIFAQAKPSYTCLQTTRDETSINKPVGLDAVLNPGDLTRAA